MKKIIIWVLLSLCVLAIIGPVLAQVSPHFDLSWNVLSGGGGVRNSAHYQIDDVLGQWPYGSARSAHYQIDPGFWYVGHVTEEWHLYLPLISGSNTGLASSTSN